MKFIRNGWDVVRLILLTAILTTAIVAPPITPYRRPAFWERIIAQALLFFVCYPIYRLIVLKFERVSQEPPK